MNPRLETPETSTTPNTWTDNALYFEYTAAVNPKFPSIPAKLYPSELHKQGETRIIPFDLSETLGLAGPATTPNVSANYLRLCPGESLTTEVAAVAQLFYVIRGSGESRSDFGTLQWQEGDVFTLPACGAVLHRAQSDAALYWVNDGPLLSMLGAAPTRPLFQPTHYPATRIAEEQKKVDAQPGSRTRNRNAIILGNPAVFKGMPVEGMSMTPTLWSTIVFVAPGEVQRPHRHNSVAVDIVLTAQEGCYSLLGKAIDANGDEINPQRVNWESGAAFVTPPTLWHSHHNESDKPAIIMAVQEASLYQRMGTLDIQFSPPPKA